MRRPKRSATRGLRHGEHSKTARGSGAHREPSKLHARWHTAALIVAGVAALSAATAGRGLAGPRTKGAPETLSAARACLDRGHLPWIGRPHLDSDPRGVVGGFILGGAPWDRQEAHVSAAELFVLRSPGLARTAAPILRSEYVLGKIPVSVLRKVPPRERPFIKAFAQIGVAPNAAARRGLERIYRNVVVIWRYPLRNATVSNRFMARCFAS